MLGKFTKYMEYYGRVKTRQILLTLSDRQLGDAGISKPLLLQGTDAWPWRGECTSIPVEPTVARKATKQLYAMTDRELQDIGVTRGEIPYAVVHGVNR